MSQSQPLKRVEELQLVTEIENAARRIGPHVLRTPLFHSVYLDELNGGEVRLKLESEQYTGSFKARGALNKVLSMPGQDKSAGLVTASTGNHAQGFARALTLSGDRGLVYLPENAEPSKVEALQHYNVELAYYGNSCVETELHAKQQAAEKGMVWVSPYNDPMIIAGQGKVHHIWANDHYKTTLNASEFKRVYNKRTNMVKEAMDARAGATREELVDAIVGAIEAGGIFSVNVDIIHTQIHERFYFFPFQQCSIGSKSDS